MTPLALMTIALDRVGLPISSTTYKDRAREYLNIALKDVGTRARWRWLYKDASFSTADGTRAYSLANDVQDVVSFRDATNDHVLQWLTTYDTDRFDPDEDESGDPEAAVLVGINSSTGVWNIEIWPTPDAVNTLSYRYYAYLRDLTESDDETDLAPKLPDWVQPALIWAVSSRFYAEKGDREQSLMDENEKELWIARALERNRQAGGPQAVRMDRKDDPPVGFEFWVQKGTLT